MQTAPRVRLSDLCYLFGRARGQEAAARRAAFGAEVNHPIRSLDQVHVVFDYDDAVARIHQALQNEQQAGRVGRVQASGGLIEQVEGAAGSATAELLGELDALGFAARKGGGRLTELQLAQPDIGHDLQP